MKIVWESNYWDNELILKSKNISTTKILIIIVLTLFTIQSVWFATTIKYKVPPDEAYHYQLTEYYSQRSIGAGPIISNQTDNFSLGDIERAPGYLYHYTLSFPLKAVSATTDSLKARVVSLRIINVGLTLLSLIVLLKIFKLIKMNDKQRLVAIVLVSGTGMFLWMSAAINYDNLAYLTFLSFIYFLMLILKNLSFRYILLAIIFAMLTLLVKTSFAPVMLLALLYVGVVVLRSKESLKLLKPKAIKKEVKKRWIVFIPIVFALLAVGLLFTERIIGNYVQYGTIAPKCNVLHTENECLKNGLYKRSAEQKKVVEELKATDSLPETKPFDFAGNWVSLMYERIFFYFGHKQMKASEAARITAFATAGFVFVLLILKSERLFKSKERRLLILVALSYIAVLFLFNFNSYLNSSVRFGFQGRYLLPVVPFLYAFVVILFTSVYKKSSKPTSYLLVAMAVVLFGFNVIHHSPSLVFYRGTDESWYYEKSKRTNSQISNGLEDFNLVVPGSLENTN